ncbi:hypothetical protein PEL8287_03908 [Roseovarius litorisediminis]|uniref:Uncharacterized protein n=1 Tax=Roseovarius litorisediminis TaxID=1312363 RepID=A0A1Y5TX58_9RHOB|nr:hypothetical protein PEL8287_03908 [Roseovarius litorisediminis]
MPKLYGYLACPRSRIALVAASEKDIDCSFRAVAYWDGLDKLSIFTVNRHRNVAPFEFDLKH